MDLVRRTIERYVKLTDAEWAEVAPCWRTCTFAKGESVSEAGKVERRFYIVESGVQRLLPHFRSALARGANDERQIADADRRSG